MFLSAFHPGANTSKLHSFIGPSLLLLFVVVGFINFDKYGVAWDEPAQRAIGEISAGYVLGIDDRLPEYVDRDYGPAFEMPMIAVEKFFRCTHLPCAYFLRHIVSHLFFLIGAYFCFLLVDFLYQNKTLASIGFLLVVLNPRFYAHSFFNTKDIPFFTWFFIIFYLSAIAFSKRKWINFLLLGAATGILINLRIVGIIMIGLVGLLLLIDCIQERHDLKRIKKNCYFFSCFFLFTILTLYVTWPFLWHNPIQNFRYVVNNMMLFRWNAEVLFDGQVVKASELPWYYLPKWFLITIPAPYIVAGVLGIALLSYNFFKKGLRLFTGEIEKNMIIYVLCFFLPLIAVVAFKSIVYDEWRHFYFVYAPFLLLIIYTINHFMQRRSGVATLIIVTCIFISVGIPLVRQNPYQHIYFNAFVDRSTPEYLKSQYELDYWGLSYREALEFILKKDLSTNIPVGIQNPAGEWNSFILKEEGRKRLKFVSNLIEARYFISNDRTFTHPLSSSEWTKIYSIKVSNNTINTVYKRINR